MARKEAIRRMDLHKSRERQGRLNEIEEEARQRTMHLLERARNLKLEQEEEIKKCNKLILETKCRAIRDAQVGYWVNLRKCESSNGGSYRNLFNLLRHISIFIPAPILYSHFKDLGYFNTIQRGFFIFLMV